MMSTPLKPWEIAAAAIDAQLHELKGRRNAVTPLYRLPVEIVERILLLAQVPERENQETYTGWITWRDDVRHIKSPRILLACRRFREVALSSNKFWANIDVVRDKHEWISQCLERSGDHGLNVRGILTGDMSDQASLLTLNLAMRSRTLRLIIYPSLEDRSDDEYYSEEEDPDEDDEYGEDPQEPKLAEVKSEPISLCFSAETPSFEECLSHIMINGATLEVSLHANAGSASEHFSLPNPLADGRSGNLTSLVLESVTFDTMPYLPRLMRLVLTDMADGGHNTKLRAILGQTPIVSFVRIETTYVLDTGRSQAMSPSKPDQTYPPVALAHLATLELSSEISQLAKLVEMFPDPIHSLAVRAHHPTAMEVNHMRSAKYKAEADLALSIQLRAVRYLSASNGQVRDWASHCLELSEEGQPNNYYKKVEFFPRPVSCNFNARSLHFSMCFGRDADVTGLASHAEQVRISLRDLSSFTSALEKTAKMNCLVVKGLHIPKSPKPETIQQSIETLDHVLAGRTQHLGVLQRLVVQYFEDGWLSNDLPDNLSKRILDIIQTKWKEAGWVFAVEWENLHVRKSSASQSYRQFPDDGLD